MGFIAESLSKAVLLIVSGSPDVVSAVSTSLMVSASAIGLASLVGIPAGISIGTGEFPEASIAHIAQQPDGDAYRGGGSVGLWSNQPAGTSRELEFTFHADRHDLRPDAVSTSDRREL